MPGYSIHPTVRLATWLAVVVFVQALSGVALLWAFAVLPLVGIRVLRRGGRMAWRARWLLLSLVVVFSWGVAGTPLLNLEYLPTKEGLLEGANQLGRLLLALVAVATFLEYVSTADLLAATHVLLKPFRRLGLDPDRGVVRLMLVLRYVEILPKPRDWRTLLDVPNLAIEQHVKVSHRRFCQVDYAVAFMALIVTVFCSYLLLV